MSREILSTTKEIDPQSPAGKWINILFPIPFLLVGLIALYFGVKTASNAMASGDWPTTVGVVTISEVSLERGTENTTYRANIAYTYAVDGKQFAGNTIYFGQSNSSNPDPAYQLVNAYKEGMEVGVFYDPTDPSQCVLIAEVRFEVFLLPGFGVVFLLMGIFLIFFTRKKRMEIGPARRDGVRSGPSIN